jgi:hypothetical protein
MYLRTGFNGLKRGMMRTSKGFKNGQQLFSKVCVWVLFVFRFYYIVFQKRVP